MSLDLTNKNISDTFQNLLQKSGSEGVLYDLVGNQIQNLAISGSVTITSSLILGGGTFTSESLSAAQAGGDNLGNHTATEDLDMATYDIKGITHITASGNISASALELNSVNATDDFFLLKSGSLNALKVNGEGVLRLGGFKFTPTAVSGGFYYNDDDDEFYLGKK